MKICWVLLKSDETPMGFAQISWVLHKSDDFIFFAQISWVWHKFDDNLIIFFLDLVSFAQIQQRSSEKYRSSPKRNLWKHLCSIRLPINPIRSDLTCWFLRSVASFLAKNQMSLGRLQVGHKPNLDRPVDTPNFKHNLLEWSITSGDSNGYIYK